MNFMDEYLDQTSGQMPAAPVITGGVSIGQKPSPPQSDYRSAYVQQLDAMSRKALTSNYGGNSQQAWQSGSSMPQFGGAPESAREYRSRTGRISARVANGPGSGPGGGLVSGGMAKTPQEWVSAFPVAPGQRPGEFGFIGPTQGGRVAGGLAFKPKPAPSWQTSTADERTQIAQKYAPKPDLRGVTRMIPAVDANPREFADRLFA